MPTLASLVMDSKAKPQTLKADETVDSSVFRIAEGDASFFEERDPDDDRMRHIDDDVEYWRYFTKAKVIDSVADPVLNRHQTIANLTRLRAFDCLRAYSLERDSAEEISLQQHYPMFDAVVFTVRGRVCTTTCLPCFRATNAYQDCVVVGCGAASALERCCIRRPVSRLATVWRRSLVKGDLSEHVSFPASCFMQYEPLRPTMVKSVALSLKQEVDPEAVFEFGFGFAILGQESTATEGESFFGFHLLTLQSNEEGRIQWFTDDDDVGEKAEETEEDEIDDDFKCEDQISCGGLESPD
jgi:hypothetical protein